MTASRAHQLAFLFDAETSPSLNPAIAGGGTSSECVRVATVFVRHPRARRYLLRVIDEQTIRVTIPRWGSRKEASAFVERERAWIDTQRRHIKEWKARHTEQALPDHAETVFGDGLPAQPRFIDQAKRELPVRVTQLATQHGLKVSRVSIRNQRWRWGSCSPGGHICLNWRLVTMPESVRDYVIIHELMHLKRMDHSSRFWKLVAAACPDFQRARRYLRERSVCR